MKPQVRPVALAAAILLSGVATFSFAQEARRPYIIQLQDEPAATYQGGISGLTGVQSLALDTAGEFLYVLGAEDGTVVQFSRTAVSGVLTVSKKASEAVSTPSLAVRVRVAVPVCPAAGVTVTVRLAPLPPKTILPAGTRDALEEIPLMVRLVSTESVSPTVNGIAVQVTTTGTVRPLAPEAEFAMLRTAPEALANVAKHGHASFSEGLDRLQ